MNSEAFLKALDSEIWWEWKWEKRNRYWMLTINWATWLARLFILGLAWFQLTSQDKDGNALWVLLSLAILSMLNIALPLLSYSFRFQERQEVHDKNAREYESIKVELQTALISLQDAVNKFTKVRREPTEKVIRSTP
ncbi:MAG TPA: hypothetical protein VLX91_03930 [Candidatus Acidoferrales bacterium]|nr:hypothetical protein [Candidatus Acidoferrales bacterium]